MQKAMLAGAGVLFVLSLMCVTATVVWMVRGDFGIGASGFWQMVVFHPVTMVAGVLLLERAGQRPAPPVQEGP